MISWKRKPSTRSLGPGKSLRLVGQRRLGQGHLEALDGYGCECDGDVTMRIGDVFTCRGRMRFARCDMPVRALVSVRGRGGMDLGGSL